MKVSLLRLTGPMISFGASSVNEDSPTWPHPSLSMLTGLIANARGYKRRETGRHQRLQQAVSYAAREDCPGEKVTDYQTADLDLPHMRATTKSDSVAWTTWGHLDNRGGGNASSGIAQREREYWADSIYTVALHIEGLSAEEIERSLRRPERPLFIGRKCCLPSEEIFQGTVQVQSLKEALFQPETIPTGSDGEKLTPTRLWHFSQEGRPISDRKDWETGLFTGTRHVKEEELSAPTPPGARDT